MTFHCKGFQFRVVVSVVLAVSAFMLACSSEQENTSADLPGGTIFFKSNRGGSLQLFRMNPDGSDVRQVTAKGGDLCSCAPDGQRIVFDRQGTTWGLYTQDLNSTDSAPLLTANYGAVSATGERFPSADFVAPAWSPNGDRIAFSAKEGGEFGPRYGPDSSPEPWNIYAIDVSTTAETLRTTKTSRGEIIVTQLTHGERPFSSSMAPNWSPDGKRLVFYTNRDGNQEIYVMNADGSGQMNLTKHEAKDMSPVWSPDGSLIAFTSTRDGNSEIYVMDASGGNPRNLTSHASEDWSPAWSPDGKWILYMTDRDGNVEIYRMRATDGRLQSNITHHPGNDGSPVWCKR